jgi:flagellar hook-associated protein 2
MSGAFSAGGLITGIDTNSLVTQLMQLERRPIFRMQRRITSLEKQQAAVKDLRTQLQTLRSKMQDFRFGIDFDSFNVDSSEESIATAIASGPNPASGSFSVNVTRLASATNVISSGGLAHPSIQPLNLPTVESIMMPRLAFSPLTVRPSISI